MRITHKWLETAYQQFHKLLYLVLICQVHVVKSMVWLLMFFSLHCRSWHKHCTCLRACLSSLQLIVMIFYKCIRRIPPSLSQSN